jgi:N-acetylneuraminic acid mutarotase
MRLATTLLMSESACSPRLKTNVASEKPITQENLTDFIPGTWYVLNAIPFLLGASRVPEMSSAPSLIHSLRLLLPAPKSSSPWPAHALATAIRLACALLLVATAHAQVGEWAWVSGGNVSYNQNGVYGTLGVPNAANVPGDRSSSTTWTDSSGNLWLFGGSGPVGGSGPGAATNSSLHFNDLWKFNPVTNQWTWVSGFDNTTVGVYGTLGVPSASNVPGSREDAAGWTDSSGALWLFGGEGYDSTRNFGSLNDLWKFDPSTNLWTWVAGGTTLPSASNTCLPGVYGSIGTPAAANIPGGRNLAVSWADTAGNFWLFGGGGCDAAGTQGILNDLWKFNPSTGQWTWIAGSSTVPFAYGNAGIYGTQGVAVASNAPGGRWTSFSWTDKSGNFWLFGGEGLDSIGARGYLNDLWEFNPSTSLWTWISGSSTLGSANCYQPGVECAQSSVYGTLGQAAAANVPGGRSGPVGSIDSNGNLWLFGGLNNANGVVNPLNDLWSFSLQTKQWAWMSGSNTVQCNAKSAQGACVSDGQNGVYGTLGSATTTNVPGSREATVSWTGKNGDLWLFGGDGFDSIGSFWPLNDLWNYQLKQSPTVTLSSNANPVFAQSTIVLTASVTSSGTVPTGNVTFLDGTTSLGTAPLNGSGIATLSVATLAAGPHLLTASYVGDTNHFAASCAPLTQMVVDFSVSSASTNTATINPGGSASYSITLGPVIPATTLPGPITLSASGGPAGATYTFSPATVPGNAGLTSEALTVTLPSVVSTFKPSVRPRNPPPISLAMTVLLLPFACKRRQRGERTGGFPRILLLILIGSLSFATLNGCGGSSSSGNNTPQPQSYTVTVTGTAGALTHSTAVTLIVN